MDHTQIVFLVDIQCLLKEQISIDQLILAFKRIALYYQHTNMKKLVLWGYRFFDSLNPNALNTSSPLYEIEEFIGIKERIESVCKGYSSSTSLQIAPFKRLHQVMKELFGDYSWEVDPNVRKGTECDPNQQQKNHVYAFTPLPNNFSDLKRFLTNESVEDKNYYAALSEATDLLIQMKDTLVKTYLDHFKQRHMSFNVIDTDFKFDRFKTQQRLFDDLIGRGVQLCCQGFNGRYILFNSLIQDYNTFGFHFYPEIAQLLIPMFMKPLYPNQPNNSTYVSQLSMVQKASQTTQNPAQRVHEIALLKKNTSVVRNGDFPLWKGPIKSFKSRKFGKAMVYKLYKDQSEFDSSFFSQSTHIQLQPSIDRLQFDPSWLTNPLENDFMITLDFDNGRSRLFLDYIRELYKNNQVGIAEQVMIKNGGKKTRIMCIVPMTQGSAAFRCLNIATIPKTSMIRTTPLECVNSSMMEHASPSVLSKKISDIAKDDKKETLPLNVTPSESVLAAMMKHKKQNEESKREGPKQEEELVIKLPQNITEFRTALEDLYYETLYERGNILYVFIQMMDSFIKAMLDKKGITVEEITSAIKRLTLDRDQHLEKYRTKVNEAKELTKPESKAKEDYYIYQWWQQRKEQDLGQHSEKESLLLLNVTDARINVILFCFLSQILKTHPSKDSKQRQKEEEDIKMYLETAVDHYVTVNFYPSVLEIAQRTDDEPDEVDKHENNFFKLLEDWFKKDLPDFTNELYESFIDEELVPSTCLEGINLSSLFNDYNKEDAKSKSKTNQKTLAQLLEEEKVAKKKAPVPIESLFKTMELSQTRTDTVSEAARAAIDKVNRSMVNGKPTIKRAGAFLVSAVSPKRPKAEPTVIKKKQVDPSLTPKTSMTRLFGYDIFEDYTEEFPTPTVGNRSFVASNVEEDDKDEFALDDLDSYDVDME